MFTLNLGGGYDTSNICRMPNWSLCLLGTSRSYLAQNQRGVIKDSKSKITSGLIENVL